METDARLRAFKIAVEDDETLAAKPSSKFQKGQDTHFADASDRSGEDLDQSNHRGYSASSFSDSSSSSSSTRSSSMRTSSLNKKKNKSKDDDSEGGIADKDNGKVSVVLGVDGKQSRCGPEREGSPTLPSSATESIGGGKIESKSKNSGSGWFGSRFHRRGHSSSPQTPTPLSCLKSTEVDGGVLSDTASPSCSEQHLFSSGNESPEAKGSISAPVSSLNTPNAAPGLLPLANKAAHSEGKAKHRRHRSLLGPLGWAKAAKAQRSQSADIEALHQMETHQKLDSLSKEDSVDCIVGGCDPVSLREVAADIKSLEVCAFPLLPASLFGIKNAGNTCFVNAALQCLRCTPGFPLAMVPDLLEHLKTSSSHKQIEDTSVESFKDGEISQRAGNGRHDVDPEASSKFMQKTDSEEVTESANVDALSEKTNGLGISCAAGEYNECEDGESLEEGANGLLNANECSSNVEANTVKASLSNDDNLELSSQENGNEQATRLKEHQSEENRQIQEPSVSQQQNAPLHVSRPEPGELSKAVSDLIRQIYVDANNDENKLRSVNAKPLVQTLARFPVASDYFDGRQQDCQEVLQLLLDLLHEDLNRNAADDEKDTPSPKDGEVDRLNGKEESGCIDADLVQDTRKDNSISSASGSFPQLSKLSPFSKSQKPGSFNPEGVDSLENENEEDDEQPLGDLASFAKSSDLNSNERLNNCVGHVMQRNGSARQESLARSMSSVTVAVDDDTSHSASVSNVSLKKEDESSKADAAWNCWLKRTSSPISDLFLGQLQSSVTCSRCGQRFTQYEPFWDLSLPLAPRAGGGSIGSWFGLNSAMPLELQDCLRAYTKDEKLEGEEAFDCNICGERTNAHKRLRIHRLPDILVLHVKRFRSKATGADKLSTDVAFPLEGLDLDEHISPESPHQNEACIYDLYAISNHSGSLLGGHYTACCRVPIAHSSPSEAAKASMVFQTEKKGKKKANAGNGYASSSSGNVDTEGVAWKWYHFNDEIVIPVEMQQVVSQNAYMLFYARRKYKDPVAAATVHKYMRQSSLPGAGTLPSEYSNGQIEGAKHRRSRSGSSISGIFDRLRTGRRHQDS